MDIAVVKEMGYLCTYPVHDEFNSNAYDDRKELKFTLLLWHIIPQQRSNISKNYEQ